MPDILFDLPLAIIGPAIVGLLCLFGVVGLLLVRRFVLPRLRIRGDDSEFTGAMLQSVMVFYGLAVALIAVTVWQSYSDASKLVSEEAAAVGVLYRSVSQYPEPLRSELQKMVADYLDYLIREAWPLQRQGKVPAVKAESVGRLMRALANFEPATEGQKLQHGQNLHAFDQAVLATRLRVDAGHTALPGILWIVILAGAVIALSSSFFFVVEDARLHGILVALLAAFMGLVIFMIFALDRPFRGDLGIGPEPYQLIYDQLIKPNA